MQEASQAEAQEREARRVPGLAWSRPLPSPRWDSPSTADPADHKGPGHWDWRQTLRPTRQTSVPGGRLAKAETEALNLAGPRGAGQAPGCKSHSLLLLNWPLTVLKNNTCYSFTLLLSTCQVPNTAIGCWDEVLSKTQCPCLYGYPKKKNLNG